MFFCFGDFFPRTFIELDVFYNQWVRCGLTDDDLALLEEELAKDPKAWPVVSGTGGMRKMRFALPYSGKSGGIRVCYLDIPTQETIFLLFCYPKNKEENLSSAELKQIQKIILEIKTAMKEGASHE